MKRTVVLTLICVLFLSTMILSVAGVEIFKIERILGQNSMGLSTDLPTSDGVPLATIGDEFDVTIRAMIPSDLDAQRVFAAVLFDDTQLELTDSQLGPELEDWGTLAGDPITNDNPGKVLIRKQYDLTGLIEPSGVNGIFEVATLTFTVLGTVESGDMIPLDIPEDFTDTVVVFADGRNQISKVQGLELTARKARLVLSGTPLTTADLGDIADLSYKAQQATCGDGVIEGVEQCDDGNKNAGDGCSAVCSVETLYDCMGEPSVCIKKKITIPDGRISGFKDLGTCGDSIVDSGEECDDGNVVSGDGCSETCFIEVECVDSEGLEHSTGHTKPRESELIAGTTTGIAGSSTSSWQRGDLVTGSDKCAEDGQLTEFYCREGYLLVHGTICEDFGMVCRNGACVEDTTGQNQQYSSVGEEIDAALEEAGVDPSNPSEDSWTAQVVSRIAAILKSWFDGESSSPRTVTTQMPLTNSTGAPLKPLPIS